MLSNAYFLAKFRFDTAENEPAKNLQIFANLLQILPDLAVSKALSLKQPAWRRAPGPRHVLRVVDDLERRNAVRFLISKALQMFANQMFANFWRARSRLYQNAILQENMRLTASFKFYKICILLHRCNLKIFAKNRFKKTAVFFNARF